MRAKSTVKPPLSFKFTIEMTEGDKCNVHFYENIEQTTSEEGDTLYTYDEYTLYDVPYHDNLKANIEAQKSAWIEKAKEAENAEPEYTELQKIQQDITDQMIENIEQGQYITELELLILGGNE